MSSLIAGDQTMYCTDLPKSRNGKITIDNFINLPILSEEAFNTIDKNKDGFITKGELKLANRYNSMKEINKVRNIWQVTI